MEPKATTNEQGDGREQYRAQVRRRILGMMLDEGVGGFLEAVSAVLREQADRQGNIGETHDVIDIGHTKLTNAADDFAHHGKLLRGMALVTAKDEQPEGTRYLVGLSDKTMANLRKYAKGPGDQSAEQMVTRLVDQLVVLSGMAGTDSASHGAMVKAANELRSRVGIFPDGDRLTTEEIEQASKSIDEMSLQIAKANGYVADKELPAAHFAGIRFTCRKTALKKYAEHPGRAFVEITASNITLLDMEAAEALCAHAEAGTVATLYGPKVTGITGWATIGSWPTIDTIREKGHDETTFNFEVHATKLDAEEWSRHRHGYQRDEALPVAELHRGTTVPDMGELKEWLADLLKLTWAARFPKLDRHHEDNADLANAFADEHRTLLESLDKVFHDGTEETDEDEEPPRVIDGPSFSGVVLGPVTIGVLPPLGDVERSIMKWLARMPDASVCTTTTQEEITACENLVSLGYLVENNTHPTIGRNWSITPKGKAFNRSATSESTDEEIERYTLEMINSGTMVSTYEGGPPAGGPRTEAALKKLVAAGAAETWRDGKHICYGSKATRAKYEPPAAPTTISADPLLDAAADAMLEALRKGPIVSNPAAPFSELTYEALVSLSRKGLAHGTHSDLTDCTTWQVTKPAQAGEPMRVASRHVHTSPFEAAPLDPTDPRGMVHALVAEHGGFGKPVPTGSTTFNRDGLLIDGKPSPLNVAFKLVAALIELEAQAPADLAGHGFADMLAFSPNPSGASREHVATCLAYAGLLHDLRTNLAIELAGLAETARGNAAKASHSVGYWTAELARMPVPQPADRPS